MPDPTLNPEDRATLLRTARRAIERGVTQHRPLRPSPLDYPPPLREPRASFVTLHHAQRLRGCIGALRPTQPLVCDVAEHAHAAALRDPRFDPVTPDEIPGLRVQVSVLSPLHPIAFTSEADLLQQLVPRVDGVVIEEPSILPGFHGKKGTFLPSVWQTFPDPREFLSQLKLKAGLPEDYWSTALRAYRYSVESVEE